VAVDERSDDDSEPDNQPGEDPDSGGVPCPPAQPGVPRVGETVEPRGPPPGSPFEDRIEEASRGNLEVLLQAVTDTVSPDTVIYLHTTTESGG